MTTDQIILCVFFICTVLFLVTLMFIVVQDFINSIIKDIKIFKKRNIKYQYCSNCEIITKHYKEKCTECEKLNVHF